MDRDAPTTVPRSAPVIAHQVAQGGDESRVGFDHVEFGALRDQREQEFGRRTCASSDLEDAQPAGSKGAGSCRERASQGFAAGRNGAGGREVADCLTEEEEVPRKRDMSAGSGHVRSPVRQQVLHIPCRGERASQTMLGYSRRTTPLGVGQPIPWRER